MDTWVTSKDRVEYYSQKGKDRFRLEYDSYIGDFWTILTASEGFYPFSHFHLNLIGWITEKVVMEIKYEIESF